MEYSEGENNDSFSSFRIDQILLHRFFVTFDWAE